jgi:hypothetical protein
MPLSLCIPTLDRWKFLAINLPQYLINPYIDEIIVSDENGNDAARIKQRFSNPKLKVFVNESPLGPFLNKRKAISLASNNLVCLMDSDNFAPVTYFEAFFKWLGDRSIDENTIYSPSFTIPQSNHPGFNFNKFNDMIVDKTNYKNAFVMDPCLLNLGNYISTKSLHQKYTLTDDEITNAKQSMGVDVLYSNYLLITKADATLITVPNMSYDHIVHNGSLYMQTQHMIDHTFFNSLYK